MGFTLPLQGPPLPKLLMLQLQVPMQCLQAAVLSDEGLILRGLALVQGTQVFMVLQQGLIGRCQLLLLLLQTLVFSLLGCVLALQHCVLRTECCVLGAQCRILHLQESRALCVVSKPRTTSRRRHQRDHKADQAWAMLLEHEDLALERVGVGEGQHGEHWP